ncbi:WYL domain-containing protein [uncultured Arcticibacterium sp.]|uniref:helix-turn-helix transcriptional regulator n=1 Tax=uncultured Arcticibacterium sp. TaxID=2173042 RepID=UPI0030F814D8
MNRLFAIHKLLRSMNSYSGSELAAELVSLGFSTNERLVALDIQELRNLGAEIPGHRFVKYCYKKPFSLLESLEGVDTANFNEILAYLRQFSRDSLPRDQVDKLLIYFEQMVRNPELEENPYIQYEKVELKNIEKLDKFYRYIVEKRVIDIDYKYFEWELVSKTIVPVLLKEYNNRWTLMAFDKEKESYQNFPLDRIINERLSSVSLAGESGFDAVRHFKDVIGVSVPVDVEKEVIVLKVGKPRAHYVNTKPWHRSQLLVEEQDEYMIFQLSIVPNLEFWAKVMEHIEDIEVMEPANLRETFLEKVEKVYARLIAN